MDPKKILYFSCEAVREAEDIIEIVRFSDSLIEGRKFIFLDEITFADRWQNAIKYIIDSPLARNKVIYVTSSSSISLKKETFPGRPIKTQYFLPLSFREFCNVFGSEGLRKEIIIGRAESLIFYFSEISRLFSTYLRCGGFPRSIYELMENGKIREETYEIYWKWLIADIAKIERSEKITGSVLRGVLKNYGTRFSLNSIAKEMEIGSHVTVREYLEILENLFVLRNIFPVDLKKGIGVFRRMRKVYFMDPFLFHSFKRQLTGRVVEDKELPAIVEGIVAEHLIRKYGEVYYYREKKEVDFYTDGKGIEVKWQEKVDEEDFPRVEFKEKILLSKNEFEVVEDNFTIMPVSIFLLI